VKNNDLALDRVGVDRTAIFALVERFDIEHLQVPLVDVLSYDGEPQVVHDPSILVRQRNRMVVQPRYLLITIVASGEIRVMFSRPTRTYQTYRTTPLLSLYGIIYVTWYTSDLPEDAGVRLRLPNSHARF